MPQSAYACAFHRLISGGEKRNADFKQK